MRGARQFCRAFLLSSAAVLALKMVGRGVSLGGRRGFYGCERVSLGKSHWRFFKKPPVEILKTTGDFFENHWWFYLARPGIVPKKAWDWTKERQAGDHFEGMGHAFSTVGGRAK